MCKRIRSMIRCRSRPYSHNRWNCRSRRNKRCMFHHKYCMPSSVSFICIHNRRCNIQHNTRRRSPNRLHTHSRLHYRNRRNSHRSCCCRSTPCVRKLCYCKCKFSQPWLPLTQSACLLCRNNSCRRNRIRQYRYNRSRKKTSAQCPLPISPMPAM